MRFQLKRWPGRTAFPARLALLAHFALLGGGAALVAPLPAGALSISLLVGGEPTATVGVGGVLAVDVFVSGLAAGGPDSLRNFELDLVFDDSVLAFQSVSFGSGLNNGNLASSLRQSGLRGGATDQAFLAEVSLLADLTFQPGAFLLGTMFFDVLSGGNVLVALGTNAAPVSPLFGDQDGDALLLDALPDPVQVEAIPEPGTALLLATGLLALGWRRTRGPSRE